MRICTAAHAVHARAEKLVQHVVFIGGDDELVNRQPHHPRHMPRADVAEIAARNGEAHLLLVRCRRVEIARSLACEPQFILLDEPFAGVDPISIVDIKDIILHLAKRNIGVIITDHNVRETLDICDRAYIMHEGKEIAKGTPKEILADQIVRQVYLGEEFKL